MLLKIGFRVSMLNVKFVNIMNVIKVKYLYFVLLLSQSAIAFSQADTLAPKQEIPANGYYIEAGSYGTKRDSDPPAYVRNLSKSGISKLEKIDWIDFGLDYRARFEIRNNDIRREKLTADYPLLLRTRTYIGIKNLIDPLRAVIEYEDANRVFGQFAVDDRDFNRNALIQAYGELYFKNALGKDAFGTSRPLSIRFGRQAFELLDRRLLANNQWRNTTNNFLGFRATLGQDKNDWSLDLLALKPIERKPKERDWASKDKNLVAAIGHIRKWSKVVSLEPYYLVLYQEPIVSNANKERFVHSPGLRAYGYLFDNHVNYDLTHTQQFGKDGNQNINAFMFTSELGYIWKEKASKPRVSLFYGQVSGDKKPTDLTQNRFERFYGFARPWSSDDYIIPENIITPKVKFEIEPIKGLKLDGGYSFYWLASSKDRFANLLAGKNNIDKTGASGNFLGHGLDFRARYKAFKFIDANIGYTHYTNGKFVLARQQSALGKTEKTSNFAYIEVSINFYDLANLIKSNKQ
jgi:hypothetical protein